MSSISKFLNVFSNIKNWQDYKFKKNKLKDSYLTFTTKGFPVSFEVILENYLIFKELFVEDFYEINKVLKNSPENPTIVDIGANVGFFCYLMISKRPESRIFEKDEDTTMAEWYSKKIKHLIL